MTHGGEGVIRRQSTSGRIFRRKTDTPNTTSTVIPSSAATTADSGATSVSKKGYPDKVIMIDTYVFRKHGEAYLIYPPGLIMVDYTNIEPSDYPIQNAMYELFIKNRIEENMTEEDQETFKNVNSPTEVAELIQRLLQTPPPQETDKTSNPLPS